VSADPGHGQALLQSLGHVTVLSADLERTRRFYCDLLGLRDGPRPAIPVPGHWFYVGNEAVVHVLPQRVGAMPGHRVDAEGPIDHFALKAEDRPALEQRLRAAGQPFESRRLADTDTWQIVLVDPDGARVELVF
jgi:catechol 2,3-dioxygenase-like lactoylglutathione lyase family enzyme